MDMKTVSVVIPVHNRPDLILVAINSCLEQTYKVSEIIIVDDGSTDNTADVVADKAKDFSQIKLIRREKSGGAAVARNDGIKFATSDYVAFLDSDDTWRPEKIEKQINVLESNSEAVAAGCGVKYNYVSRSPRIAIPKERVTSYDLALSNVIGSTSVGIARRSALISIGGFDEKLPNCEDWDLWFRLSKISPVLVVQDVLMDYTFIAEVKLSRDCDKLFKGHLILFEKIKSNFNDAGFIRKISAFHNIKLAELEVRVRGDKPSAVNYLIRALKEKFDLPIIKLCLKIFALSIFVGPKT